MKKNIYLIVLAFFAIYVIWGSTYLMNKIAVDDISPLFLGSMRFIIAGILIFIIAKILKQDLAITKKQLVNCFIAGFLFLAYGNGVFVWALKYVDSGFAALMASTQPLMVLVLMRLIDGKKIKTTSIIGVTLGLIGIYLLVSQDEMIRHEHSVIGLIMIFTCVLSWSSGSIFVSKATLPKNFFISSGYQMVTGGFMLLISSVVVGEEWKHPTLWKDSTHISLGLLIILGSIVAFTAFNYLLKFISTEKVATSAYVNPVIAMFLGWYVLEEQITLQSIIAACILFLGVYFINSKKVVKPRISGR